MVDPMEPSVGEYVVMVSPRRGFSLGASICRYNLKKEVLSGSLKL
jgi:hypothetical protein